MSEITIVNQRLNPSVLADAPAPQTQAGALLNLIERVALDPTADINRLQMLLDMQRQVLADEARVAFEQAMTGAQAEMLPVVRDATNTHTKARYAKLEAIDAAIRPIYTKHGLSLSFNQTEAESGIAVTCKVAHVRGHSERYTLAGALDNVGAGGNTNKTPIQAMGSTVSYLRRYLTCMIFNVTLTNEDNDGNAPRAARTITPSQKDTLVELMRETSTDTVKFLAYCGVPTLDDLPMADYPRALGALQKKARTPEGK